MKTRILNFKKRSLDLFAKEYSNISIIEQLNFALISFYSTPCSDIKEIPKKWNPVFLHYSCGMFDPYRMGTAEHNFHNTDDLFEPWKGPSGVERTKMFLEKTKKLMDEDNYHTDTFRAVTVDYIMSCHFIITRESLDDNKDIIGFYHIESKKYKRYLINDVRGLCKLLRFSSYDFTRIFGHYKEFKYFGRDLPKEEFQKKVSKIIEDASHIAIKDENILTMLSFFRDTDDNVATLSS